MTALILYHINVVIILYFLITNTVSLCCISSINYQCLLEACDLPKKVIFPPEAIIGPLIASSLIIVTPFPHLLLKNVLVNNYYNGDVIR